MKNKIVFFYIFILLFLQACSNNVLKIQNNAIEENPTIINLNSNSKISFDELILNLIQADIVLIGEYHDNPIHHKVELVLTEALQKKIKNADLVMEMISSDKQIFIDNTKKDISPKMLKESIKWDKKWNYEYYSDIVKNVFYSDWKLVGGNLSKDEINTILNGAMHIKGKYSVTKDIQDKISKIIQASHKIEDKDILSKYVQIQQYKDRRMADKLVSSKHFSVLIAGNHHINKTFGVPLHIKDFKSNKKIISLFIVNEKERIQKNEGDFAFIVKEYDE